jgi:hypothetical protein
MTIAFTLFWGGWNYFPKEVFDPYNTQIYVNYLKKNGIPLFCYGLFIGDTSTVILASLSHRWIDQPVRGNRGTRKGGVRIGVLPYHRIYQTVRGGRGARRGCVWEGILSRY